MAKDQGVTVKQLVEDKDLQKKIDIKKYVTAEVGITATNVKVVYGSYETEGQAYKALHDLRNNEVFADGWITKVTE